jgi:hypothetical protein
LETPYGQSVDICEVRTSRLASNSVCAAAPLIVACLAAPLIVAGAMSSEREPSQPPHRYPTAGWAKLRDDDAA